MIDISRNYKRNIIIANLLSLDEVRKLNEAGKIKKNYKDPIQKDTVPVPDAGFTVMRFRADNPGFWIMHCHIDFHNHEGMALVLQVFRNLKIVVFIENCENTVRQEIIFSKILIKIPFSDWRERKGQTNS